MALSLPLAIQARMGRLDPHDEQSLMGGGMHAGDVVTAGTAYNKHPLSQESVAFRLETERRRDL
jgi:hypothetical protein